MEGDSDIIMVDAPQSQETSPALQNSYNSYGSTNERSSTNALVSRLSTINYPQRTLPNAQNPSRGGLARAQNPPRLNPCARYIQLRESTGWDPYRPFGASRRSRRGPLSNPKLRRLLANREPTTMKDCFLEGRVEDAQEKVKKAAARVDRNSLLNTPGKRPASEIIESITKRPRLSQNWTFQAGENPFYEREESPEEEFPILDMPGAFPVLPSRDQSPERQIRAPSAFQTTAIRNNIALAGRSIYARVCRITGLVRGAHRTVGQRIRAGANFAVTVRQRVRVAEEPTPMGIDVDQESRPTSQPFESPFEIDEDEDAAASAQLQAEFLNYQSAQELPPSPHHVAAASPDPAAQLQAELADYSSHFVIPDLPIITAQTSSANFANDEVDQASISLHEETMSDAGASISEVHDDAQSQVLLEPQIIPSIEQTDSTDQQIQDEQHRASSPVLPSGPEPELASTSLSNMSADERRLRAAFRSGSSEREITLPRVAFKARRGRRPVLRAIESAPTDGPALEHIEKTADVSSSSAHEPSISDEQNVIVVDNDDEDEEPRSSIEQDVIEIDDDDDDDDASQVDEQEVIQLDENDEDVESLADETTTTHPTEQEEAASEVSEAVESQPEDVDDEEDNEADDESEVESDAESSNDEAEGSEVESQARDSDDESDLEGVPVYLRRNPYLRHIIEANYGREGAREMWRQAAEEEKKRRALLQAQQDAQDLAEALDRLEAAEAAHAEHKRARRAAREAARNAQAPAPAPAPARAPTPEPPRRRLPPSLRRLNTGITETTQLLAATRVADASTETPQQQPPRSERHVEWLNFGAPSAVRWFSTFSPPINLNHYTSPIPPFRAEFEAYQASRRAEEERWEREQRERLRQERVQSLARVSVPAGEAAVRPIPEEWENRVRSAMSGPAHRVLAATSDAELTKQKLETCFRPLAWLNDEVINGHLSYIVEHLRRRANNLGRNVLPKYHAFNSFFYSNLRDNGYQSISRWARRAKIDGANLLNVETVFIPVHEGAHWTLLVVSPRLRIIEYFDSLGGRPDRFIETIKGWLKEELGNSYDESQWMVLDTKSPRQDNGSDCGVFLLTTAKAVALGLEPTSYGPRDIRLIRRKIVAELMNGGLDGDFDPLGPSGAPRL